MSDPDEFDVDITIDTPAYDTELAVALITGTGPPGPAGPPGPQGPPGSAGSAPQAYVHSQATSANVWTITHNLGFNPNVAVVDSAGTNVEGDVTYTTVNTLTIAFTASFTGTAYLT